MLNVVVSFETPNKDIKNVMLLAVSSDVIELSIL